MASTWRRLRELWIGLAAFALTSAALMMFASAAHAQYSDGYTFLKGVKDRDGAKVQPLLDKPGTTIVNARDSDTGDTALHIVVRGRDMVWTNYLLAKGADANARNTAGETPLIVAVHLGWVEGAQALIARRAGVNTGNSRGETPLILAVQARDPEMVRLLLANGADPKQGDRATGMSARDYAARDPRAAAILKMIDEAKPAAPKPAVAGPVF